jgi:hypothetical protein
LAAGGLALEAACLLVVELHLSDGWFLDDLIRWRGGLFDRGRLRQSLTDALDPARLLLRGARG